MFKKKITGFFYRFSDYLHYVYNPENCLYSEENIIKVRAFDALAHATHTIKKIITNIDNLKRKKNESENASGNYFSTSLWRIYYQQEKPQDTRLITRTFVNSSASDYINYSNIENIKEQLKNLGLNQKLIEFIVWDLNPGILKSQDLNTFLTMARKFFYAKTQKKAIPFYFAPEIRVHIYKNEIINQTVHIISKIWIDWMQDNQFLFTKLARTSNFLLHQVEINKKAICLETEYIITLSDKEEPTLRNASAWLSLPMQKTQSFLRVDLCNSTLLTVDNFLSCDDVSDPYLRITFGILIDLFSTKNNLNNNIINNDQNFNVKVTTEKYMAKKVLTCISCLSLTRTNLFPTEYKDDKFIKIQKKTRDNIISTARGHANTLNVDKEIQNSLLVLMCLSMKIGRCFEFAHLTLAFLCHFNFSGYIGICNGVDGFDHAFILISTTKHSFEDTDVYQFKNLPSDVLILDAWLNIYFYPHKKNSYETKAWKINIGHSFNQVKFTVNNFMSTQDHKKTKFFTFISTHNYFNFILSLIQNFHKKKVHIYSKYHNTALYRKDYFKDDDFLLSTYEPKIMDMPKTNWVVGGVFQRPKSGNLKLQRILLQNNENYIEASLKRKHFTTKNKFINEINFQYANLEQSNFKSIEWKFPNFQYSNLKNANFQNVVMSFPNLWKSNLEGSNLENSKLVEASLVSANLVNANLKKATLINAKLHHANLHGAHLQKVNLHNANLYKANLQNTKLGGADLSYANLDMAKLQNAILINATLINATLINADLSYADLQYADLSEANFTAACLNEANLERAILKDACFEFAQLNNAFLKNLNFENVLLRETQLERADLQNTRLQGVCLYKANLEGANLKGANLEAANLEKAVLKNANLEGANLINANLKNANLQGINSTNANFQGADLTGALRDLIL